MKEKLYDIPIDHSLTVAKRKTISDYIDRNAHLAPAKSSHEWDDDVLLLKTPPAEWEIIFQPKNVEVHGSAPFWARLLLTKEKRIQLKEQIELLLHKTGFIDTKPKGAKPAGALNKAK